MDLILMIVAFGALMYFLMIRPQQKRMKEHQAAIGALAPGSRVLMTSGMFGTVRHLGERQAIVELAPGVEITVVKGNIARPVTADEEEFEFADEADAHPLLETEPLVEDAYLPGTEGFDQEATFDPRGDGDMSPEELQRKFDDN